MSVSQRIIKRREELGFSQSELARRAGLKPPAISQYESGARTPSYEAVIKLSNALSLSADYLMSGKEVNSDIISDTTVKLLLKIVETFSVKQKERLLEYARFLGKCYETDEIPLLNDSNEYANFILKKYFAGRVPVDVSAIAKQLNISVYESNLGEHGEGMLFNEKEKVIIINSEIKYEPRKKFTLAVLLGHAIIPWHVKSTYEIRKKGTSTILTEDIEEMEAQNFAASLIMPLTEINKDFIKVDATIESLKKLASEKYDVSLFVLLNRLVDSAKSKHSVVQSENWKILKEYQGNRTLIYKINPGSVAATFFNNVPEIEEIRKGTVPAKCWLIDAKSDETIYEESIYNPEYNKVLTLLTMV